MKIIDLLNKIANGEDVPDFRIFDYEDTRDYEVSDSGIHDMTNNKWTMLKYYCDGDKYSTIDYNLLNKEVEIIEDNKKICKLDWIEGNTFDKIKENSYLSREEARLLDSNFKELGTKINEIIDKLNEMGDK